NEQRRCVLLEPLQSRRVRPIHRRPSSRGGAPIGIQGRVYDALTNGRVQNPTKGFFVLSALTSPNSLSVPTNAVNATGSGRSTFHRTCRSHSRASSSLKSAFRITSSTE